MSEARNGNGTATPLADSRIEHAESIHAEDIHTEAIHTEAIHATAIQEWPEPTWKDKPTVSLVIPVRNEARNIAWVLDQIADDVDEIIVVDGNSTDATLITARRRRPDIRVIPQEGIGKGSALRTGFQAATGDIVVMMDADGSMAPQEIRHYLHFLSNGYDFAKGSRFIGGGGSLDITHFRRMGNRFLLAVFNHLYDTDLTDLCYGFCAFHRRYLEHLELAATGFEIVAEMVVRAVQAGLRIVEVPSLELPRRAGQSNLHAVRDGTRVLNTVVRGHRTGLSGRIVQRVVSRHADRIAAGSAHPVRS